MGLTLEVCVDTVAGLEAAVQGGADRVELCTALSVGGLTPAVGFMELAGRYGVPVVAMVRPRAGDFVWSEAEVGVMERDIAAAREAGLAGVVLGASLADGRLDGVVLVRLIGAARGMEVTLHRCFDLVPDRGEALEVAVRLGFGRVLTSGGAATAVAGVGRLRGLVGQAAPVLLDAGVRELHGSCAKSVAVSGRGVEMGFGPAVERRTDLGAVRALKRAMEDWRGHHPEL